MQLNFREDFTEDIKSTEKLPVLERKGSTLSVCVTGTFNKTRSEIQQVLRAAGYAVHANIYTSTTYLLVGRNPGSRKLEAAANHRIKQVSPIDLGIAI